MKKILFASSEAVPFIKTGGLADVVGSLPKYFDRKQFDVRVILPKYACIDQKLKAKMKRVADFTVKLGWRNQSARILKAKADGIQYYFVENEFYFAGERPYGEIYQDVEKFAFFSKAVLEALDKINFLPDIIHCNDWQTGLLPVFLCEEYRAKEDYRNIRTVFSIHNICFQGRWILHEVKDITGLREEVFTMRGIEAYGESNYLKGGIVYSDAVTAVSETYSKEIMTPEGGMGLDGALRSCSHKISGIVNGLDYEVFHPKKDAYIAAPFDVKTFAANKPKNKAKLQEMMGLPKEKDTFLIGMVSRMSDQKGFDLVAYILDEFLEKEKVQIAVLGTGESRYENMFRHFEKKYPKKLSAMIGYSESAAHQIYAGADAFLMPSLFEPCGLSQLISLRYGTVPIVRETGGLKDIVEPYNKYTNEGTGFSFAHYNAHEMADMIRFAMEVYYTQKQNWNQLAARGMKKNFSWESSVRKYERLYGCLCN